VREANSSKTRVSQNIIWREAPKKDFLHNHHPKKILSPKAAKDFLHNPYQKNILPQKAATHL
jgi:hypothetical protein